MAVISLLTDFGLEDAYVGIVKGVILSVNPSAVIVDISHNIAPQDVTGAADLLGTAYAYFPPGTVHLAVVDPGVGSNRAVIAVETKRHRFLAPDNGILTGVLSGGDVIRAVSVENSRYFLSPISQTFHGRDIFAPVAAHLSMGLELGALGPVVDHDTLVRLRFPQSVRTDQNEISGVIMAIDRFGNLITNIRERDIGLFLAHTEGPDVIIQVGGQIISGLSDSYASVPIGKPLAVMGSSGRLEISVNGGSAHRFFNAGFGETVLVSTADAR